MCVCECGCWRHTLIMEASKANIDTFDTLMSLTLKNNIILLNKIKLQNKIDILITILELKSNACTHEN